MTITYIKDIHFDFEPDDKNPIGPHIAYTTPKYGGAASGKNEAYLFKAMTTINNGNTDTNNTHDNNTKTKTGGSCKDGDINKTQVNKINDDKEKSKLDEKLMKAMQEELDALKQEREDLKKSLEDQAIVLKTKEIEKSLVGYNFDEEAMKALSGVMVAMEDTAPITNAFDALVKKSEEDITKAMDDKKADENPLKKMLDDEVGDAGDPGAPVEKSLIDEINEAAKLV